MKIKILSAQKKIFEGESKEIILPGEGGEISVWDFHQPCLCRLRPGVIKIRPYGWENRGLASDSQSHGEDKAKELVQFRVLSGIAKILPQETTVLLET